MSKNRPTRLERDASGNTLLHLSARAGHETAIHFLVQDDGADVNSFNIHKETPLHSATAGKDKEVGLRIMNYLLDHGANPYAKDKDDDTFLHIYGIQFDTPTPSQFHSTVECLLERNLINLFSYPGGSNGASPVQLVVGYLEPEEKTLTLLHSHGVNLNFQDSDGDSLLAYAVHGMRSTKFLSFLINQIGADPKQLNGKGENLLQIAAYSGTAAALKYFINLGVVSNPNQVSVWNGLLHLALDPESDQIDVIDKCRLLIGKGANRNCKSPGMKKTPLILAAMGSGVEVIRWIIQNGADPYAKDKSGQTFLHHYLKRKDEPPTPSEFHLMVEYLIGKGRSKIFNVLGGGSEIYECTPLSLALRRLELEERTLTLLSSNNVNFKTLDEKGDSAVAYAVMGNRSVKLLSILIEEFRVKWRLHNTHRNSILHIASEFSNFEALKFFLDMGGLDVNGVDGDGDTPVHCAVHQVGKMGFLEKCKLLIGKGADVNITNNLGDTPLSTMLREYEGEDKEELVKLLGGSDNYEKLSKKRGSARTHLKPKNK